MLQIVANDRLQYSFSSLNMANAFYVAFHLPIFFWIFLYSPDIKLFKWILILDMTPVWNQKYKEKDRDMLLIKMICSTNWLPLKNIAENKYLCLVNLS